MQPICPPHFPWKDYRKYTYPLGLDLGAVCVLSGTSASEYDAVTGKIVARGDLAAQTATALEKIGTVLTAAGYAFADTVSLVQYVTPAAFAALPSVPPLFAARGIDLSRVHVVAVDRLMRRDALIELELTAARPEARRPAEGLTQSVRVGLGDGALIFPGGDAGTAATPASSLHDAIAGEVQAAGAVLRAAGIGWAQVARCRLALADAGVAEVDQAVAELRALLPDLPAVPVIGVAALPAGRRVQLSVELCADTAEAPPPVAVAGGLVRRVGPLLVATGLGCDDATRDLVGQCAQLYGTVIPELLASAGIEMSGIVQTVEWVTAEALPDYRATGAVRRQYLKEPFPVASGLVCSALPARRRIAIDIIAADRQRLS